MTNLAPTQRGELSGNKPPQDIEAECALLGSMILDHRVIVDVQAIIGGPQDFYKSIHGAIYKLIVQMHDAGQDVDMVMVNGKAKDLGILEQIGGLEYLIELAESVPSASSAAYYARRVRDKYTQRSVIDLCGATLENAYNSSEPVADLVERLERDVFALAGTANHTDSVTIGGILQQTYDDIANATGVFADGLKSGFYDLDGLTGGFRSGELTIIAARPSMGKTALALNIAAAVGLSGTPVVFYSLEMSRQMLAMRMLCSGARVASGRMSKNMLSSDEFDSLSGHVGRLQASGLMVDDQPGLSVSLLRSRCRRLADRYAIKAVFVDYLQIMATKNAENRNLQVAEMTAGLKALAIELSVPVICLSQLNRSMASREDKTPRLSDLRDSGSIEQDADVVLMLHREDYYHMGDHNYSPSHTADLFVRKNRNGPTGVVKLVFSPEFTRFDNMAVGYDRGLGVGQ